MKYNIAHEFDCDAKTFWEIFFSEEYNDDLYAGLKIKERKVLKYEEDDREIRRAIKIVPERDLPGALKSFVKGDLGYIEHNVFHKGKDAMDVHIEPTLMKDRFKMNGVFRVVPVRPGRIRREFVGTIDVSVPLLGGQIEKLVMGDVQKSYDEAAKVTARWLAKRK
ncbi:MAG TPA: DUF2505 domain-containing protein [Polyangia bacterium]|jgi:hypothetical protein